MVGRPRVTPLEKKKSKPTWSPLDWSRSVAACQGSTEEGQVTVCLRLGRGVTTSVNWPFGAKVPAYSSLMAWPTQLRLSDEPCVSQVFEYSVIHMRRYRTGIFQETS